MDVICQKQGRMFHQISDETLFCVLDINSQILREIQSKSSPKFMIIRITHANLIHGTDFLDFLYMNYS